MASETHITLPPHRPVQVDHSCGHRFTHLMAVFGDVDGELLDVLELLSANPCPSCAAGASDWAVGSALGRSAGSEAGAC